MLPRASRERPSRHRSHRRGPAAAGWLVGTVSLVAVSVVCAAGLAPAAAPHPVHRLAEKETGSVISTPQDLPSGTITIDGTRYPDPLRLDNGNRVRDTATWEQQRRPELLKAFEENVYGTTLPAPEKTTYDVAELGGNGRKVTINVTGPAGTAHFTLRVFVPQGAKPKGTFLLIDHRGSVSDDPGSTSSFAPTKKILDAGYAFAAVNAKEVAPDDDGSFRDGVIDAFHPADEKLPDDAGRAVSAWAWGASRAMDYLATDKDIDPEKVAVIGHSRGGKAALWAGAQDVRFPVVISNNSGSTGAKLARRDHSGESISAITNAFPHWFPETYDRYAGKADALPVDQHELIALVAPGRAVVSSATGDGNADPEGEFLAAQGAEPVYEMYGLTNKNLVSARWPVAADKGLVGPGVSYYLRSGDHGLGDDDWANYLDANLFAE